MAKRIAIVCENFKVDKFKEELNALNIEYEIDKALSGDTLTCIACLSEQSVIGPIVKKVHQFFTDKFKAEKNAGRD